MVTGGARSPKEGVTIVIDEYKEFIKERGCLIIKFTDAQAADLMETLSLLMEEGENDRGKTQSANTVREVSEIDPALSLGHGKKAVRVPGGKKEYGKSRPGKAS
jgi:hypothetical protein